MHALQRYSFWAAGVAAFLLSVLFSAVFLVSPAQAKGEIYSYDTQADVIYVRGGIIKGYATLKPATQKPNPKPGTTAYTGYIEVTPRPSRRAEAFKSSNQPPTCTYQMSVSFYDADSRDNYIEPGDPITFHVSGPVASKTVRPDMCIAGHRNAFTGNFITKHLSGYSPIINLAGIDYIVQRPPGDTLIKRCDPGYTYNKETDECRDQLFRGGTCQGDGRKVTRPVTGPGGTGKTTYCVDEPNITKGCPPGYTYDKQSDECRDQLLPDGTCQGDGTKVTRPATGPGGTTSVTYCVDDPVGDHGPTPGGADKKSGKGVRCNTESAFSWIICPAVSLLSTVNKAVVAVIDDMLFVKPLDIDTRGNLYAIWQSFVVIANILFIFIMFALIYSQATSTGISAYGIKKMLPKLVAAAIFANISFFICAVAVDISNVLGVGVKVLMDNVIDVTGGGSGKYSTDYFQWAGWPIAVAAASVGVLLLLFFVGGTILLLLLVAMLTLAARQALVIILVIVSPIAFALWVLPNTEKYFKQWGELFLSTLMMFPLTILIIVGSRLASNVVAATATNSFVQVMAIFIAFLPLVLLPLLFKVGGWTLGQINKAAKGSKLGTAAEGINSGMKRKGRNTMARAADNRWADRGDFRGKIGRSVQRFGNMPGARKRRAQSQDAQAEQMQGSAYASRMTRPGSGQGGYSRGANRLASRAAGPAGVSGANAARAAAIEAKRKQQREEGRAMALQIQERVGTDNADVGEDFLQALRSGRTMDTAEMMGYRDLLMTDQTGREYIRAGVSSGGTRSGVASSGMQNRETARAVGEAFTDEGTLGKIDQQMSDMVPYFSKMKGSPDQGVFDPTKDANYNLDSRKILGGVDNKVFEEMDRNNDRVGTDRQMQRTEARRALSTPNSEQFLRGKGRNALERRFP